MSYHARLIFLTFKNFLRTPTAAQPHPAACTGRPELRQWSHTLTKISQCHLQPTDNNRPRWVMSRQWNVWRRLVKMYSMCVCVCVWREERRGGAVPNSEKVKVRERRCSPTTEKCEKQGGKMWSEPEEEGRRWLGVVNDFARRSQTALARLGEVGNNASLCQALTNQPCALKMKKRKKNRLHWLQRADWESHACKTWHAQEACEMRYGYSSTEVNDAREVLHQRNTIDETKYLTTQLATYGCWLCPACIAIKY